MGKQPKCGIPMYRVFDGKRYRLWSMLNRKQEAEEDARFWRKEGYYIRVTKIPTGLDIPANWAVWIRKMGKKRDDRR